MTLPTRLTLATLGAALLCAAQPNFNPPAGWTRSSAAPNLFTLEAPPARDQVTIFLGGRPLNNTAFTAAFDQDTNALNGNLRVVRSGGVKPSTDPARGYQLLSLAVELAAPPPSNQRLFRQYLASNPGDRIEMLVYTANTMPLFDQHLPDLQRFIASWTSQGQLQQPQQPGPPSAVAPSSPPPRSAATPGSGIRLYAGYRNVYEPVQGVVRARSRIDYYILFPDGSAYWGLPARGLATFSLAEARRNMPEFTGTYRISPDQSRIDIVMSNGKFPVTGIVTPAGMDIDKRPYTLQADLAQRGPHALSGIFGRADAVPSLPDMMRRVIRFTPDGRFEDRGIIESVATVELVNGNYRPERSAGTGTYQLVNFTLLLRYDDGEVRTLPLYVEPAQFQAPTVTRLHVNTYVLTAR